MPGLKFSLRSLLLSLGIISGLCGNTQVSSSPEPLGGERELKEFIRNEMIYPQKSLEAGIKGKVLLNLLISGKGVLNGIQIPEKVNGEIDQEAVRIAKKILWIPGTNLGRPADLPYYLEIDFSPKKYHSYVKSRGYSTPTVAEPANDTSYRVYEQVNVQIPASPIFSSIDGGLPGFINNNLKYPEAAFKQNISGTVKLRFVIETYGKISHISIINSVGGGCNEEAIRLARMINWKPAVKDGLTVRSYNSLEIIFDIAKKSVQDASGQGQVH